MDERKARDILAGVLARRYGENDKVVLLTLSGDLSDVDLMGLDAVAAMKRAYDAGHADGGKYGWQADVSGPLVSKPDPARNGAQPPPNPFPK
jgi:hypothetical protein